MGVKLRQSLHYWSLFVFEEKVASALRLCHITVLAL